MQPPGAIGGVNVLATFIAIATIDHLGRRKLLLAGLIGMGLSLTAVGFAFLQLRNGSPGGETTSGVVTLIALVVFIISFAFSLGPVTWTVINEIYPGVVRGRAVAVATAVNWGAAFLVSGFFLSIVKALGEPVCFWLFAAFCAIGFIWVFLRVPETQGPIVGRDPAVLGGGRITEARRLRRRYGARSTLTTFRPCSTSRLSARTATLR